MDNLFTHIYYTSCTHLTFLLLCNNLVTRANAKIISQWKVFHYFQILLHTSTVTLLQLQVTSKSNTLNFLSTCNTFSISILIATSSHTSSSYLRLHDLLLLSLGC